MSIDISRVEMQLQEFQHRCEYLHGIIAIYPTARRIKELGFRRKLVECCEKTRNKYRRQQIAKRHLASIKKIGWHRIATRGHNG